MTDSTLTRGRDQARPHAMRCAGCCAPIFGEASTITAGARTDTVCCACMLRAEASAVFLELVGACIQWRTTLPDMVKVFAGLGLRSPETHEQVHFVMREAMRRYEAANRGRA